MLFLKKGFLTPGKHSRGDCLDRLSLDPSKHCGLWSGWLRPGGYPVPRKVLEWTYRTGRSSHMLGCALVFAWVWLAASTIRAAWDCSLKCDVYPSQGGIPTWNR